MDPAAHITKGRGSPAVVRGRWRALLLALLLTGCGSASGGAQAAMAPVGLENGEPAARARAATSVVAPPRPAQDAEASLPLAAGLRGFCVHGGAPLVGRPLVDARGRLFLVTGDGYLHSYEADGRYRFSFTVSGTPLGSPSLRGSDGAILLGTTARSVYGIGPEGQLSFRARTVTPVWSGLHARDGSSVVYIGLDRFLYALSNHGAALYRVAIPGQPVGEPVVAPDGVVWIPLDTGLARLEQAFSVKRFPTSDPIDEIALGAEGPLVRSAGAFFSFDERGVAVRRGPAETLLADGTSVLALDGAGGGAWLARGDPALAVSLGAHEALETSGEGGLSGARALLPLATGEIALLDVRRPDQPHVRRVPVLDEPLVWAAFAQAGARLLVSSRSGRACLVDDPFAAASRAR